ncbi:MAG TPA: hypothetical protein VJY54_14490 [Lachnospiraceae bacterium]|nr:hypothetical protein [Lachnospiraceae bacterium]
MRYQGKWAEQMIQLQQADGKWGHFHSLSANSGSPITTEQALRRLECLGYTIEDDCIQKAVGYLNDCLSGKKQIPDRREKHTDWDAFINLMLATWIRRFTDENVLANQIAEKWTYIVSSCFETGVFDRKRYSSLFLEVFGVISRKDSLFDIEHFYIVSILQNCLDSRTEDLFTSYLLNYPLGIYYVYDRCLSELPPIFESKQASRYLGAVEMLAKYQQAHEKLGFVAEWLNNNRNENGKWDMGSIVNDKIYFPLSDSWRNKETREADCTVRIEALLTEIKSFL